MMGRNHRAQNSNDNGYETLQSNPLAGAIPVEYSLRWEEQKNKGILLQRWEQPGSTLVTKTGPILTFGAPHCAWRLVKAVSGISSSDKPAP
eukprot:3126116-Amphidinium_carterae.2